jgi:UPF0755 protein
MKRLLIVLCLICTLLLCACSKEDIKEEIKEIVSDATTTTAIPTATVTFPEGFTAVQIAEKLEKKGVCSAEAFLALVTDDEYLSTLTYRFVKGIESPSDRPFNLEGYIFPDTYEFYKGESAERALKRFLDNTEAKLTDEFYTRAEELGYTMDEIIALAAIVQEEATTVEEMGKVSSVVHNRIVSPGYGKIQCDVTIHYINDYVTDSPYIAGDTEKYKELYNTYKCVGLPEGAITNPGLDAIKSALYPEDTDYFFFVTDEDWNYYYAETYEEHRKNCAAVGLVG